MTINNEKMQAELLQALREKMNKVAPEAAAAISEDQPLGASPKVGVAGRIIGVAAAAAVQRGIIAKRTGMFFFKEVKRAFTQTRESFQALDQVYTTMVQNIKQEKTQEQKEADINAVAEKLAAELKAAGEVK